MAKPNSASVEELASQLLQGDRRALGRAITLVESTNHNDELNADQLLALVMPRSGNSLRLGISGAPGVGKSSFIEAVGMSLIAASKRVAVLAVDPSSPVNGGSILGDKTRMEQLSVSENSFVRPSPSGDASGGVARHTRESILLCEAAGYDVVIVETVGVGQSDVVVASMIDYFILLQQPFAGDELQGIKRGILELADLICVTKADGDTLEGAKRTQGDLNRALSFGFSHRHQSADVILFTNKSVESSQNLSTRLLKLLASSEFSNLRAQRRQCQASEWFKEEVKEVISRHLAKNSDTKPYMDALHSVESHQVPASSAARKYVKSLFHTTEQI